MAIARHGLSRWDPFRDFPRFPAWASRAMDDVFEGEATPRMVSPAIDVSETGEHYLINAELPGVKRDEIELELHEGVLTIKGEKREERSGEDEKNRWVERTFGSFSRSLRLPQDADPQQVEASFEDGVLRIRVHKVAEAKPRNVEIRG